MKRSADFGREGESGTKRGKPQSENEVSEASSEEADEEQKFTLEKDFFSEITHWNLVHEGANNEFKTLFEEGFEEFTRLNEIIISTPLPSSAPIADSLVSAMCNTIKDRGWKLAISFDENLSYECKKRWMNEFSFHTDSCQITLPELQPVSVDNVPPLTELVAKFIGREFGKKISFFAGSRVLKIIEKSVKEEVKKGFEKQKLDTEESSENEEKPLDFGTP